MRQPLHHHASSQIHVTLQEEPGADTPPHGQRKQTASVRKPDAQKNLGNWGNTGCLHSYLNLGIMFSVNATYLVDAAGLPLLPSPFHQELSTTPVPALKFFPAACPSWGTTLCPIRALACPPYLRPKHSFLIFFLIFPSSSRYENTCQGVTWPKYFH